MAELDATQMPEEIIPSEELATTEETPEEVVVTDQEPAKKSSFKIQVPKPQAPKPTQPKRVTEEEKKKILEIAKPKTITSTSTETGLLQTSAEAMSTGVEKPPVAELKSKAPDIVSNETPEEKSKREYFDKKLEYQLSSGKKPEFKINAKYELEKFLGGDPSKINWEAYDQSKKAEINKAIRDEMEKDIDPMYDPTGTLQFISSMTPNALKSGLSSVYSGLVALGGAAIEFHEKASKQRVAGAAFGETAEERKATLPKPGEELSTDFYKHALKFQERSEKYMIAAELNSGIKEKNVGKGAFELLTSNEPGDTWDGLTKLGLSVTQQIPQLVALATTGGSTAGVFAGAAALGTGTALTEEYKKDRDISAIDAWKSIAKGAIEGATENLFKADINALRSLGGAAIKLDMSGAKKTMKDFLAERGRKALEDQINRTYLKAIGTTIKNSLGEGGEEILAAIGSFIVDRIEDGKWVQEEYDKLQKQVQEGFLIGATTGFSASVPAIRGSVTPLTTEQKRRIVNFRQIANDETADKSVREIAQKHADDIIKYNADLSMRKYAVIASLPIAKRKIALDIESKIRGLEDSKKKVKDVDVEAQIDKDVKNLQEKWSNVVVSHAIETAQADAKAKAERKANAPKVMTSTSTEVSTAAETMQVDTSMMQGDFDILKGLTTEEKQTLINIQNAIQSIDPDARVMLYANQDELKKGLLLSGLSAEESSKRSSYSEAVLTANSKGGDPIIHVNLSSPSNSIESAAHEAAHIALMQLAKDNPEAFVAMRDTVLRMMKNSQSKPLIDFANQYGRDKDGNLIEDAKNNQERAEEFLVQMVGTLTAGKGKIERTVLDQIARALRDFLLKASRAMGSRSLEAMINKAFENTTSGEQLAKYFEGLAAQLKVGGKIDVSYLSDAIPLTPAQEQRLQGLAPGSEQYHEAAQLNATENSPSNARPTMAADDSLVENPNDTIARSQMTKMTESEQHKKYLRVVKGMEPGDIWLSRALAMDENRGGKLFAIGNKDKILEEMQKEMDQIEADANHSNKYYLTELKPGYIAAQIAKYEKDPRFTDNLTEWKMIRDNQGMRERYIQEKAAEQKGSLTGNIAYLKGNETYSIPFQYAMIKDGISSRYTVEAAEDGGERKIQRDTIKPSQLNNTEKPIITMQPGIVASAYADYGDLNTEPGRGYLVAQINMPKIEVTQSEFAPFIFKQSDTGEGYWLKFNQSSSIEDAKPLHKIASTSHKYPAQWCTGGAVDTAKMHLTGGDFYVFVDNKTGDARIAVRYKGKNEISEVRGLGQGQSVLPNDAGIIDELVNDLPGGIEYKKDAKVQNTLKEILDSLPDEASKKRFTLNERDFKQWIIDGNYEKITETPINTAGFDDSIKKKIIEIDGVIEDAVINKLTEGNYSKQDIIDIISIKDKSYREQNHALTRTKQVISNNTDKVFKPFGYEDGSVSKGIVIKGSDNPSEYQNIRLIIGDLGFSNTGDSISLPNLEDVTGRIRVSDSWGVDIELIKRSPATISFPKITNLSKLEIDSPWGNFKLNFDSLKKVDELVIEDNENNNRIELNFPKLETFESNENLYIGEKMSFNAPSLKAITSDGDNAYVDVYGELNAPNLNLVDGDLVIEEGGVANLDKLKEVSILKIKGGTVDLPNLKNVSSIQVDNNTVLNLNEIDTNVNGVSWESKIHARDNSKIFINKLATFSDSRSTTIEASDNSKIRISEIEREGGFNILGGVNRYYAYDQSEITVLKGSNTSWANVDIINESKVNLPGVYRIKELTVDDSTFTSDSAENVYSVDISNGSVNLNNTIGIDKAKVNGVSSFKADNLGSLGDLSVIFFAEGVGKHKIHLPKLDNVRKLKIEGSELSLPNIKNVWIELRVSDYAKANLPNLTLVGGEGLTVGNNSFASIPSLNRISAKSLYINSDSQLDAPELSELPKDTYIQESSKLVAPKLGYNGTSSPDATVAKSQMSKDIKKLDDAIYTVSMAPSVKSWMEPEFIAERRGIPQTGTPATVVFGKKDNPEGVSDFVAYYSENGNLVSVLNMLTEPNKDSMSSKGAFKITVDPAERRKGYAKILLDAAQDNGLDIIGNVKANRFSSIGRDLVRDWIQSKRDALADQISDSPLTVKSRLAPNGKPSKLTASQYETVRTPEFKAWFGDWENDPENASKFVDENGEPQVFYHGTYAEFDRFSTDPELKRHDIHNKGIFFTPTIRGAKEYGDIQMPVFLRAKTVEYNTANINNPFKVERQKENDLIDNTDKEGVVLTTVDKESYAVGDKDGLVKQYVVFDPNQILTAGDKTYVKSQLAAPMYAGTVEEDKYLPGTTSAKKAEDEGISFSEALTAAYKEAAERNTNVADLIKNAGMMQSFYNLYNKAGATPFATIMFRDAYADVYGKMDGKKLSAKDKGFLDDIILLRRTIAIDENFDNRNEARPLHTSFDDYETKKEVPLSKEEALKQLEFLKTNVYNTRRDKLAELERRANNYFKAFSDILKYKYENGVITKDEYDMYKDYNYQPRKFLKFIKGDTPQSAFNTRGVQITRNEIKKIESGDTGYMMTDSEKLLKMGFISAVNKVFSNRAKQAMFEELNGRNLGWAKPANYDTYADGTVKLNKDGSPKLMEPDAGYRNMTFKVEGKVNAFQLKENLAKEYEDEEMWDTRNWLYRASTKAMGAWLTSAMAVGVNASFVIANISTDLASQLFANNLYSSKFGVLGQGGKALSGTLANSLRIAKLKTGLGDNSRILNAINEYGKMGGMQQTLANETGAATKVGEALSILADISELAARITAFENKRNDLIKDYIKKNGSDPVGKEYEKILMQASYEARAAMDYHRGGRTTKFLNPLFAFLNVTTQGAKITASYIKNNYKAFSSKIFQAGGAMMALTFYNMMMAGDDWENEDLKRAKRDKIIIFSPFKNADGTHSYNKYQIPTPIKFFFNVFQSIAENIFYNAYAPAMGIKVPPVDKTANKEMADNLKSFVPPAASQMPSTAKFFYEYSNNYSLWNQRALSQDALKDIIPSQEGEENPEILSFYKVLFRKASEITDGAIEISPERFQKASEDSFLTSPENQFLLAGFYTILDQMTNAMVGGVDPKIRSKYLANGDFSDALSASFGTFKNRLIGTTDKTKNEKIRDLKEDAEYIHRLQRIENSKNQDISNTIKTIFKKYKDAGVEYTDAKEEVMHYYKSLESKRDKEYAKNYIEKMIGSAKVEYKENIPVYLMIQNVAKDSDTKAKAIYTLFTLKGKDPMKDKVLGKDLFTIGFRGSVMDAYKKLVAKEEAKKAEQAPTVEGVDPETGLPPGFDPTKY